MLGRFEGSVAVVTGAASGIGKACVASDDARFMTGGFHLVDGGGATTRYPDLPAAMARFLGASGTAS